MDGMRTPNASDSCGAIDGAERYGPTAPALWQMRFLYQPRSGIEHGRSGLGRKRRFHQLWNDPVFFRVVTNRRAKSDFQQPGWRWKARLIKISLLIRIEMVSEVKVKT
jgi:hypothetical protein